ncbi:MAG: DEAD/DEAH box helicase, partial [Gemmatimonadota bacterium]
MRCREVSPRQAALVILEAWFGGDRTPSTTSLPLTDFQHDAVSRLDRIFEQRRGALLADAVGLGKTFVALAIIDRALQRDESVALVIPAALRRHWLHHLKRLPANRRAAVAVLTHTALSFGRASNTDFALVVVDEAHAFRNPRTRRYASLLQVTRSARVLLLSATPVNNRLEDLYHQIALFAADHDFAYLGVGSLRTVFKHAGTDPRAQQSVQRVLEAVMVRRSREHVRSTQHGLAFPTRAPPNAIRYDLVAAYGSAWSTVYNALGQLSFAAFSNSGIPTAVELMRLQLLKRLESSIAAFTSSVRRQLQINRLLLGSLGAERWIKPASLRSLIVGDGMDAQLTLDALLTEIVPRGCNTAELHAAATTDVRLLQACLRALGGADALGDPKLAALSPLVARHNGIIVFTQYRDTAVYVWRDLLRHSRVGLVHGSEARLGTQRAARSTVIECFAPRANGARLPHERMRLDVLVATDVLSEGLNLQDASTVISYDLPWNPVTLMQRIGRVDRLGSAHETINVYNFLPDRGLDALLHLVE